MTINESLKRLEEMANDEQKVAINNLNEFIIKTLTSGEKVDGNKMFNYVMDINKVYPEYVCMMYTLSLVSGLAICSEDEGMLEKAAEVSGTNIEDYMK